jgi:hypothetical protein
MEEAPSRSLREVAGVAVVRSRLGGVIIVLAMQVRLRAIIQITESLYWVSGSTGGRFIESCGIYGLAWVYLQERAQEPVEDDMRPQRSGNKGFTKA